MAQEQCEQSTEHIMGTMAVPGLVLRTSVPLMVSLLANSLYNLVDSIFVSHVSEDALTALTLSSPVQLLMSALGCGTAVGLNAVISKAMGEGDREKVRDTASAAMVMSILSAALIAVCCALFIGPYFQWQAEGSQVIMDYGVAYLRVCMLFSLGTMSQWVFDRFLIATGKSMLFLATLGCAALVNLILDPIFIFGYFGLTAMETTGAAIATVIGQFCGAGLGIVLNRRYNREIPLRFTLKIRLGRVGDILRVGIPTAVTQGIVSLMGIVMNSLLWGFSSTAVAVYGVCARIQNLATIGTHGFTNGLIPIVAYNYGAKQPQRIRQTIQWALLYGFAFGLAALLLLELFPRPILWLFQASDTMLGMGIPAIRIMAVAFTISSLGLLLAATFQALGSAQPSMILTLARQVVFLLAFLLLFLRLGRLELLWWAFPMAEVCAIPMGLLLLRQVWRKRFRSTEEKPDK